MSLNGGETAGKVGKGEWCDSKFDDPLDVPNLGVLQQWTLER